MRSGVFLLRKREITMTNVKPLAQGMSIKGRDQYSKEDALIYGTLKLFETYGYDVIEPPSIEYYDVMHASGVSAQQSMIKFIDPFGDIMVLQADPTISLSHYMSKQPNKTLRKFAMVSSIHRAYTMHSKRHEHFKQIGIEVYHDQEVYDEEVIELALKALSHAQVKDVVFELGHVGFIPALLTSLDLSTIEIENLIQIIASKDGPAMKLKIQDYLKETQDILNQVMTWFGPIEQVSKQLEKVTLNETCSQMVDQLKSLVDYAKSLNYTNQIIMDLTTVKNQSYYSGLTLTAYSNEVTQPILSGGRYEYEINGELEKMNAIGFGIDVSMLARVTHLTPPKLENIAIVAKIEDKERAFKKANEIRSSSTRVHVLFSKDVDLSMMDDIITLTEE
jgi:ATP phosphoribosyltransferase regulatory subunit